MLSEPLTWLEICARYPNEWVVLVEVDWLGEDDKDFRSARVAGHGKTRREPLVQARSMWPRYGEIAHFFTGPIRPTLGLTLLRQFNIEIRPSEGRLLVDRVSAA